MDDSLAGWRRGADAAASNLHEDAAMTRRKFIDAAIP